MSNEELKNSPLHGLSAEVMLTELVEFYGWEILDAAVDLKCFRIKPTIPSCLTFLKKAEWARNRVEDFYLYRFKGMPSPSEKELELKPRERGFPEGIAPRKPVALTVNQLRKERVERGEEVVPRHEPVEEEQLSDSFTSRFRKTIVPKKDSNDS